MAKIKFMDCELLSIAKLEGEGDNSDGVFFK